MPHPPPAVVLTLACYFFLTRLVGVCVSIIYSLPVASLSKNLRWSRLERLPPPPPSGVGVSCVVVVLVWGGFVCWFFFFFFPSFCGLISEASGVKVKWCN